jgi:hypothetical protein
VLRSDSEYVVNTMTRNWKRNANLELWRRLDSEAALRKVRFEWVRGHGDDRLNQRADELAQMAAQGATGIESGDADFARLLRAGETIAKCAGCGKPFVSAAGERYCSLVACQSLARRDT